MTGIIFSPAAQTDIDKIWDYTATSWNVDQAERYIQDKETLATNWRREDG
nr:type II toxin-antitoxin system RelE/ParE family toxin [Rhizobium leguminosarum]